MTKRQFGNDVFDKLMSTVDIPVYNRIIVQRDLRDRVSIATLEAIDKLLKKIKEV